MGAEQARIYKNGYAGIIVDHFLMEIQLLERFTLNDRIDYSV